MWQVLVFLIAFWSPKQSKNEGELYMIHGKANGSSNTWRIQDFDLRSPLPKPIRNARRKNKERNLTWKIQEGRNSWTHFKHFMESISCMLYVILKLVKSEVQHFKQCVNRSWNEEVIAIGSQLHQVESQFRCCEITTWAAKSAFLCEMETFSLWNFAAPQPHFAAVKWPAKSTWVLPDICDRLF